MIWILFSVSAFFVGGIVACQVDMRLRRRKHVKNWQLEYSFPALFCLIFLPVFLSPLYIEYQSYQKDFKPWGITSKKLMEVKSDGNIYEPKVFVFTPPWEDVKFFYHPIGAQYLGDVRENVQIDNGVIVSLTYSLVLKYLSPADFLTLTGGKKEGATEYKKNLMKSILGFHSSNLDEIRQIIISASATKCAGGDNKDDMDLAKLAMHSYLIRLFADKFVSPAGVKVRVSEIYFDLS